MYLCDAGYECGVTELKALCVWTCCDFVYIYICDELILLRFCFLLKPLEDEKNKNVYHKNKAFKITTLKQIEPSTDTSMH